MVDSGAIRAEIIRVRTRVRSVRCSPTIHVKFDPNPSRNFRHNGVKCRLVQPFLGLGMFSRWFHICGVLWRGLSAAPVMRQISAGPPLISALREGGYVLVMRHASSPTMPPDKASADRENTGLERQLDETGRNTARAMGKAIKALHLPIRDVFSSPTYRRSETVHIAGLPQPRTVAELGDGGQSMAPLQASPAAWLRNMVSQVPPAGTDVMIVTHAPNITGAFGASVADVTDGEILVFRPDGQWRCHARRTHQDRGLAEPRQTEIDIVDRR